MKYKKLQNTKSYIVQKVEFLFKQKIYFSINNFFPELHIFKELNEIVLLEFFNNCNFFSWIFLFLLLIANLIFDHQIMLVEQVLIYCSFLDVINFDSFFFLLLKLKLWNRKILSWKRRKWKNVDLEVIGIYIIYNIILFKNQRSWMEIFKILKISWKLKFSKLTIIHNFKFILR